MKPHRSVIALLAGVAAITGAFLLAPFSLPSIAQKAKPAQAVSEKPLPEIGQGRDDLPPPVVEMRDAIIAAAHTGSLDELLIPIQWNELPPDFGDLSVADTLAAWKKASPDGTGREWLALLIELLEAPYAVLRRGADHENNKIFIWPAFAEIPLDRLSPKLEVQLLRLVTAENMQQMKSSGGYNGFGLAIGADGTWHAFKRTTVTTPKASTTSAPKSK